MRRVAFFLIYTFSIAFHIYGQSKEIPYIILVSFDGFRYDYANLFNAKNFKAFAEKGSESEGLIPSFPSKTVPNHYTIVTGLYPGRHGLVDNTFFDPSRQQFYGVKIHERVIDPFYYGGVPLWKLAKEHGLKSASFFWIGSELPQTDLHPDYYFSYDESVPDTARVEQVLKWLSLPADQRPHFISLYFSSPDHEAHHYGPASKETARAVLHADTLLSSLMAGVKKTNLPVNVILVSDHGMIAHKHQSETYIFLDEIIDMDDPSIKTSNGGTQTHIYVPDVGKRDSIYTSLKSKAVNFSVYKQEQFPPHWHYNNARSGDLLITAHKGYYIRERNRTKFLGTLKVGSTIGVHGYDAKEVIEMRGIFLAQGPNIKSGIKIPSFENVHVYPLIAKILGLPVLNIDGSALVLEKVYQEQE